MPSFPAYFASLALLAALLTGVALGYKWRDNSAKLHESREQQRYTQALNEALDKARRQEQALYAQMEALTRDTEKQLESVAAAERAAFDSRLHELAQQYAHRRPAPNPPAAANCQAERTRAAVLANLLAESDQLAQSFATEADRRRIAGLACEAAYEAARLGK